MGIEDCTGTGKGKTKQIARYEQIAIDLKEEIKKGTIGAGQKLPSIRQLTQMYSCSKSTVIRAMQKLEEKNWAYSVPRSGFYAIHKFRPERAEEPKADFASARPSVTMLPHMDFSGAIREAADLYKGSLYTYHKPEGMESLRTELHKQFVDQQIFCNQDQIVITTGIQQAITILFRMDFGQGKSRILLEKPTYRGAIQAAKHAGVSVTGITRRYEGLDLSELESELRTGNVKCLYTIPALHNPLGSSYDAKQMKAILELAEKYNTYIVEDDYLGDLHVVRGRRTFHELDTGGRVIYLKSYSKTFLPGLRIGAAVLPKPLVGMFTEQKKWLDLSSPALSQGALEVYLRSGLMQSHVKRMRDEYTRRMEVLRTIMETSDLEKWLVPSCGFFASFEVERQMNTDQVVHLLKQRGIWLDDCKGTYPGGMKDRKLLRLSVANANVPVIEANVPILLQTLKQDSLVRKRSFVPNYL